MYYAGYNERFRDQMMFVENFYEKRIYRPIESIKSVAVYETCDHLRLPPDDGYGTINAGESWGKEWASAWFRFSFTVPESAAGKAIYVVPHTNAVETLCYRNGKPAGIINSKNMFLGGWHSAMFVCDNAAPGDQYDIALECYAGHFCSQSHPNEFYGLDHDGVYSHSFDGIDVCVMHRPTYDFCFDLATVRQLADLPDDNFVSAKAKLALFGAYKAIVQDVADHTDDEIDAAVPAAIAALAPALEKVTPETSRGLVGLVGHSHMDTAWLWTVPETIRKCARTYSEVLSLMDRYPEYTFIQSSTLHLEWMKEYYPDIFEGIKKRVKEGRYEPNGGVYVECDGNMAGGEAMIRQFMYGQRFTKENFGYEADTFWLADTFGYNASIPKIIRGCGLKYFCTTKMSWNDLNRFPLDTFYWKGNDGTEVLTHLNILQISPDVVGTNKAVAALRDKPSCDRKLMSYGFGDGGGGPTDGMLEYARRTEGLPGMPEMHHTTVSDFMNSLEADAGKYHYPTYENELYLERHRGSLTSMHDIKRNNRLAEIALHDMEYMNVLSGEARAEKTDRLYKTLLQNHFHDTLSGSLMTEANETAIAEVAGLIKEAREEADKFASEITDNSASLTLFNTSPVDRTADMPFDIADGGFAPKTAKAQRFTDALGRKKIAISGMNIAAYGAVSADKTAVTEGGRSPFIFDGKTLETPYYTAVIDENGYIAELTDKRANRRVDSGKYPLGTLYFGENFPSDCDNWEIELNAFDKLAPLSAESAAAKVSDGEVEYRIRSVYRFGHDSTATVDTVFYAGSPRIDFAIVVDWHEKHSLLKSGYDIAVKSPTIRNEMQFGFTDRPTTRNNSLEIGMYEVCNHKYSDMSEPRYGVSFLNDCKYGLSAEGSNVMLTLMKSGTHPDTTGDPGIHEMTYSLLPHVGCFTADTTVAPAYAFNYQPIVTDGKADIAPLVKISETNIICETVKPAEYADNAFVVRLYEAESSHTRCEVRFGRDIKEAYETNMLEENAQPVSHENGAVKLSFRPFEVKTLLIKY